MWLALAFLSALLLGFYDVFKKKALSWNAVIPVLTLNVLFSSLLFLPFIVLSAQGVIREDALLHVQAYGWGEHKYIVGKSLIVLSSWLFGYFGIKNLPLTIVGPINATRPVMVLIGALTLFGESLTLFQWLGVITAMIGLWLLSRSGKKEGIDFKHNKWIVFVLLSNILGALSGLYDKYLMAPPENGGIGLDKMAVQSWFNIYQLGMMSIALLLLWWPQHKRSTPFHWSWFIPLISLFLSAADFCYFYSLSLDGAMISIVSMIRRGSVVVSFLFGALAFHEKNLKAKVIDLLLVLLSMVLLFIGSQ
jgi:drug/metabolite transporter (DMT)-like permease